MPHPDRGHAAQLACYIKIDFETGIDAAKINLSAVDYEPPFATAGT